MFCNDCQTLLEALTEAAKRHIHHEGKLRIASIQQDGDSMRLLERTVEQFRTIRERALEVFRAHRLLHEQPTRHA